jgi:hypothetical protein
VSVTQFFIEAPTDEGGRRDLDPTVGAECEEGEGHVLGAEGEGDGAFSDRVEDSDEREEDCTLLPHATISDGQAVVDVELRGRSGERLALDRRLVLLLLLLQRRVPLVFTDWTDAVNERTAMRAEDGWRALAIGAALG